MLAIDHQSCLLCSGCIGVCPEMALSMDLDGLKISPALCTLCGICIGFCPVIALMEKVFNHPDGINR